MIQYLLHIIFSYDAHDLPPACMVLGWERIFRRSVSTHSGLKLRMHDYRLLKVNSEEFDELYSRFNRTAEFKLTVPRLQNFYLNTESCKITNMFFLGAAHYETTRLHY